MFVDRNDFHGNFGWQRRRCRYADVDDDDDYYYLFRFKHFVIVLPTHVNRPNGSHGTCHMA